MMPQTAADVVRSRIGMYLSGLEIEHTVAGELFLVPYQSAVIWVAAVEAADEDNGSVALLVLISVLSTGLSLNSSLYEYVAHNQPQLGSLQLGVDANGEPVATARFAMPGDYLDEAEFRLALMQFAAQSDLLGHHIQAAFGGRVSRE